MVTSLLTGADSLSKMATCALCRAGTRRWLSCGMMSFSVHPGSPLPSPFPNAGQQGLIRCIPTPPCCPHPPPRDFPSLLSHLGPGTHLNALLLCPPSADHCWRKPTAAALWGMVCKAPGPSGVPTNPFCLSLALLFLFLKNISRLHCSPQGPLST